MAIAGNPGSPNGKARFTRSRTVDVFVAAGSRNNILNLDQEAGAILTSRDGLAWVEEPNPDNYFLSRLVFSRDLFVGFGGRLESDGSRIQPVIVTSPNGRNWTERWRSDEMGCSSWRPAMIAGNGTIVIVGQSTSGFLISTNGVDWSRVVPGWSPIADPLWPTK